MKTFVSAALMLGILSLGLTGCAEKTSVKSETKVTTPGGTTTVTKETEIKKTGDNPPPP
jgi:hypothetical protein